MKKKLPDLEAWAIFAKVAQTGSFAKTATELALSQATVSKAVTRLEARMKTMLFHRTSRRLSLTESGHAALERAERILAEGEAVEAEMVEQSATLRGVIRLSAPMSFGIERLSPLLPEFLQQHAEVSLDIQFDDRRVDLVAEGLDMALRIANLADSSLLARHLCRMRILLVGAPEYFQRYGRPQHPRDLAEHRALQYSYSAGGAHWRFRHASQGEFTQALPVVMRANNAEALTPALLAGLGLALQPEFLIWQQLQAGQVEIAMEDWSVEPLALCLVAPPGRRRPARVQALMDYLANRFMQEPWAQTAAPAVLVPPG